MRITLEINGFGQMFGVPNLIVDQYLKLATPSQLKILLYLLRHGNQQVNNKEITDALSISEELVEEAILFWTQTDLFKVTTPIETEMADSTQNEKQSEDMTTQTALVEKPNSSRKQTPIFSSLKSGELSPVEITAALEKSDDLKDLFRMSEQQMGRPLRHVEQKALVWMHDYHNIGSDIILTVLSYCKSIDNCSVSYAESLIVSWWNDGLQTLSQVTSAINDMEHRRSFTGQIRKIFEMQRKPTPKQQEFIDAWQEKEIPLELITYAYEKTLEGTDKLSFPYLNSILTRWMEAGYRSRQDVDLKDHSPMPAFKKKTAKKPKKESKNADAYASFVYNIDE